MASGHRRAILDNLNVLSDSTSLTKRVLNTCVERKIITRDESTKIEREGHLDDYETKSYFYNKVLKQKDLDTFQKYVELAQEADTPQPADVIQILKNALTASDSANGGISNNTSAPPRLLPNFNFENKTREDGTSFAKLPWTCPVVSVTADMPPPQKYVVRATKKFALIVNITHFQTHDERRGANYDSAAMATVLEDFGFDVSEIEGQVTLEGLKAKLRAFKIMCINGGADVCILAIMSHGEKDIIATSDNHRVNINADILAQFNNKNFKEFIGKPKIFFIQACRGRERDTGAIPSTMRDGNTFTTYRNACAEELVIPTWTDMLVCYATLEGQFSYRETKGSWFIQVLCRKLREYGHKLDINRILVLMAEQMKEEQGSNGEKQISPWTNIGFTKEFYFN